jgi:ABC-type sugar transport system permease subunit
MERASAMTHPVVRQLRDFALGAFVAIIIATCAFVAVRNTELVARQIDLAERAADAVAKGRPAAPEVQIVIVGEAVPSAKHAYLRQRHIHDGGQWRPLAAGGSPDDKLFYDTANRSERRAISASELVAAHLARIPQVLELARAGAGDAAMLLARRPFALPLSELLRDGSARAIAVRPADPTEPAIAALAATHPSARPALPPQSVVIAVTPPASPAPYPWLVIIGVLGLGAMLAAAGALLSAPGALGVPGRVARLGTFVGIATLAIPCVLWRAPVATTAIVLVAAALALAQRARWTDRLARGVRQHRAALGFLAPAAVSMLVLVATPFVIGLFLGFYDHHQGQWTFVGLDNFGEILSGGGRPLDDPLNFWFILGVTVLWTVANVALHVTIGVALALLLSRTWLRGRGFLRMLFILPWAIPNYITALIFKGMFGMEHGAINSLLGHAGLDGVNWFSSWASSFSANVITNTWLGFPFMMVVALGALETIPKDLYEAASVDGAGAWQRFRHITLPHLRPALGPAVALGSIWTFNMFNVIYLVSAGDPGGSTNILVTDAYRWAFERGERYGMAAAYGTIIFLILLLWTVFGTRIVRKQGGDS